MRIWVKLINPDYRTPGSLQTFGHLNCLVTLLSRAGIARLSFASAIKIWLRKIDKQVGILSVCD